jgi:hypothetical protein
LEPRVWSTANKNHNAVSPIQWRHMDEVELGYCNGHWYSNNV